MLTFDYPVSRSDLARALGISRISLLRYEAQGLIPPAQRVSGSSLCSPEAQMAAAALVEARS